jgi:alpha,alpha-trehalose phosphorylase
MRDYDGVLTFRPRLFRQDLRIEFPLMLRGRRIRVEIKPGEVSYTLCRGDELTLWHEEEEIRLTPKNPVARRSLVKVEPA